MVITLKKNVLYSWKLLLENILVFLSLLECAYVCGARAYVEQTSIAGVFL